MYDLFALHRDSSMASRFRFRCCLCRVVAVVVVAREENKRQTEREISSENVTNDPNYVSVAETCPPGAKAMITYHGGVRIFKKKNGPKEVLVVPTTTLLLGVVLR